MWKKIFDIIFAIWKFYLWWYLQLAPEWMIPDRKNRYIKKVCAGPHNRTRAAKWVLFWWRHRADVFVEFFKPYEAHVQLNKAGWYLIDMKKKKLIGQDDEPILGNTLDFSFVEEFTY